MAIDKKDLLEALGTLDETEKRAVVEELYPPTKLTRLQSELAALDKAVAEGNTAVNNLLAPFRAAVANGELSAVAPTIDDVRNAFCGK